MADILPNITESNVLNALRNYLLTIVGCEVIRGQVNRVSMPKGDFIVLTPIQRVALSTNVDEYVAASSKKTIERPIKFTVQIDCYGGAAGERAQTISMLLRDENSTLNFAGSGFDIATLYADDPQQMPLLTGENQYLERWTFNAIIQMNPIVNIYQDFATSLD
ncbi:MAG: hypothetical protein KGI54_18440, partial [Pseudomonadota bacterium]|nr:hypothetical protein [Pseudomonadota bacterium]